jgi:UDP-glucose 4-epimerase
MALWLVTGGCGFIGSHLVDALLRRGDKVRVLDDLSTGKRENLAPGAELRIGDVADENAVASAFEGIDGCFHLAAIASVQRCNDDWLGAHRTNLQGTITVFETARRAAVAPRLPIVYASSAAVYGDNADIPLKETATTSPISGYGADKLASELHAKVAWHVHRIPNIGLRFFNVYGPRQDPSSPYSGVIAIFADRLARRQQIEIFGDGEQVRDFIYVGDVVASMVAAMTQLRAGAPVFNLCTGHGTTILELAELIGRVLGYAPVIRHRSARAGDIRASIGDPSAAEKALGVAARASMLEGLGRTLAIDEGRSAAGLASR